MDPAYHRPQLVTRFAFANYLGRVPNLVGVSDILLCIGMAVRK